MKIKVLFFGLTHELTGLQEDHVELAEGGNLDHLRRLCEGRFPRLREFAGSLLLAVNQQVAESSSPLQDGDEVAFMPPVSGGCGSCRDVYRITRDKVTTADLAESLKGPQAGAVVVFEGIVREQSHGRKTLYLEYEAYEPMAIRKMEEIGEEARSRFEIENVGIIHRVGKLEIGETSVAIVVTAAHRQAAFEACQYAINRLKQTVPIWKKEFFEDGGVWAEGEAPIRSLVEAKG